MSDENKSIQEEIQTQPQAAQQVHNGGQGGSVVDNKADRELIDAMKRVNEDANKTMQVYAFDLAKRVEKLTIWIVVLTIVSFLSCAATVGMVTWSSFQSATYMQRVNDRHWELSKQKGFASSQDRSASKKSKDAEADPDMP